MPSAVAPPPAEAPPADARPKAEQGEGEAAGAASDRNMMARAPATTRHPPRILVLGRCALARRALTRRGRAESVLEGALDGADAGDDDAGHARAAAGPA